jgi:3-dehydroquinate synthase
VREPRSGGALRVRSGPGTYSVRIGAGLLGRLALDVARGRLGAGREVPSLVAIVSDSRVARLHGEGLLRELRRLGVRATLLAFPAGERHKTRETKARLEDRLATAGLGRDGLVVGLGGGVTGDLAGFLAATWHRGVPFVQAPTTLIAMLDASIGGKVGVNHPRGKNLVGAFHPPLAVYADTTTLDTLPAREFRSGLAEAVKCGVIADRGLFRLLERESAGLLRREPRAALRVIRGAVAVKARIVSLDERETGPRMLLNFGHTLGHALEAAGGFRMRHGEAVALGMVLEARIARRMGLLPAEDAERIEGLLRALRLPVAPPGFGPSPRAILEAAGRDKKARGGKLRIVLPSGIGRHAGGRAWALHVPAALVGEILRAFLRG